MTNVAYVTNNGVSKLAAAVSSGGTIEINSAIIGTTVLTDQSAATLEATTSIAGSVYTASGSNITYNLPASNTVQFNVILGSNVGNFNVGNWGVYLSDGTMFAIISYDSATAASLTKTATSGNTSGNLLTIDVVVPINNLSSVNLTLLQQSLASLPEVATDTALPLPASPPYPVYFVHSNTQYETLFSNLGTIPSIAARYNDIWYHIPLASNVFDFASLIATIQFSGSSSGGTIQLPVFNGGPTLVLNWGQVTIPSTTQVASVAIDSGVVNVFTGMAVATGAEPYQCVPINFQFSGPTYIYAPSYIIDQSGTIGEVTTNTGPGFAAVSRTFTVTANWWVLGYKDA